MQAGLICVSDIVLRKTAAPVVDVNMNPSLDDFHLLRAFLFKTQPVDMTPRH